MMASHSRRRWVSFLTLTAMIVGCGGSEVPLSEDAEQSIDALYTALTSRRQDLVQQTSDRLSQLHTKGELPDDMNEQLNAIIQLARKDEWSEAAQELDTLIRSRTE